MGFLKIPEDEPIEAKMISGAIESAQSKIEGMNFDLRKHLLDYDDVLNKHREVIYKKRREFFSIENCLPTGDVPQGQQLSILASKIRESLKTDEEKKFFGEKLKELGDNFNEVAKVVSLRTLDMLWMEHLEEMEALRDSVRLRAYGQQDPLVEYKTEGHRMFKKLLDMIEANIAQTILKVSLKQTPQQNVGLPAEAPRSGAKAGRNDPCPCGATHPDGRPIKYKHCHGKNA